MSLYGKLVPSVEVVRQDIIWEMPLWTRVEPQFGLPTAKVGIKELNMVWLIHNT